MRSTLKQVKNYNTVRDFILAIKIKTSTLIKHQLQNPKQIPIIIINYNQLNTVLLLIAWLRQNGYLNIHILDNNSDYQPLLDFYNNTNVNVIRLEHNYGHMALWKIPHIIKKFFNGYYVATDADIIPDENCPDNFMAKFIEVLKEQPQATKAGFGLKIDDIPDHYPLKSQVIDWEARYWKENIADNLYRANIDTTFALYRPYSYKGV